MSASGTLLGSKVGILGCLRPTAYTKWRAGEVWAGGRQPAWCRDLQDPAVFSCRKQNAKSLFCKMNKKVNLCNSLRSFIFLTPCFLSVFFFFLWLNCYCSSWLITTLRFLCLLLLSFFVQCSCGKSLVFLLFGYQKLLKLWTYITVLALQAARLLFFFFFFLAGRSLQ